MTYHARLVVKLKVKTCYYVTIVIEVFIKNVFALSSKKKIMNLGIALSVLHI